jgi:hypothetical protein
MGRTRRTTSGRVSLILAVSVRQGLNPRSVSGVYGPQAMNTENAAAASDLGSDVMSGGSCSGAVAQVYSSTKRTHREDFRHLEIVSATILPAESGERAGEESGAAAPLCAAANFQIPVKAQGDARAISERAGALEGDRPFCELRGLFCGVVVLYYPTDDDDVVLARGISGWSKMWGEGTYGGGGRGVAEVAEFVVLANAFRELVYPVVQYCEGIQPQQRRAE